MPPEAPTLNSNALSFIDVLQLQKLTDWNAESPYSENQAYLPSTPGKTNSRLNELVVTKQAAVLTGPSQQQGQGGQIPSTENNGLPEGLSGQTSLIITDQQMDTPQNLERLNQLIAAVANLPESILSDYERGEKPDGISYQDVALHAIGAAGALLKQPGANANPEAFQELARQAERVDTLPVGNGGDVQESVDSYVDLMAKVMQQVVDAGILAQTVAYEAATARTDMSKEALDKSNQSAEEMKSSASKDFGLQLFFRSVGVLAGATTTILAIRNQPGKSSNNESLEEGPTKAKQRKLSDGTRRPGGLDSGSESNNAANRNKPTAQVGEKRKTQRREQQENERSMQRKEESAVQGVKGERKQQAQRLDSEEAGIKIRKKHVARQEPGDENLRPGSTNTEGVQTEGGTNKASADSNATPASKKQKVAEENSGQRGPWLNFLHETMQGFAGMGQAAGGLFGLNDKTQAAIDENQAKYDENLSSKNATLFQGSDDAAKASIQAAKSISDSENETKRSIMRNRG